MRFKDVFRLVLVLLGAFAGFEIGRTMDHHSPIPIFGMILGVLIAYVIGGVLGRLIDREQYRAVDRFARVPPGEFFAGTLIGMGGILLGAAICLPLLVLHDKAVVYPIITIVAWIFGWIGYRIGISKGRQIVAAAGLSRILAPPTEPPPGYALLADTSAVLDRSLLVLGRNGLLVGGLVVPRFVIDQVQAMAASPDPSSSRRARRGLESLEALREMRVPVHVAENELPEINDLDDRLLEIGKRLGLRLATCSTRVLDQAAKRSQPCTDLRRFAADLMPNIPPGEHIVIDLERAGNQPRQAVGFLPDGDMVVVNDAAHLVGREDVVVEVLSTRSTSQGMMVFARLTQPRSDHNVTALPGAHVDDRDDTNAAKRLGITELRADRST